MFLRLRFFTFTIICSFFFSINIGLAQQQHLTTTAKVGDGIYTLLDNYALPITQCNVDYFCKINKIKEDSYLIADKKYKLPIFLYTYNGTSIRSTIDNNNWDLAIRIQDYNKQQFEKQNKSGDYEKDNVLWVPYYLLKCPKVTPAVTKKDHFKPTTRRYDIFGKKHRDVTIQSNDLKSCIFYIVSGHGGPDPGAIYDKGSKMLCEDEYAYDISLRLARSLIERGAIVYLITRDANDGIRSGTYLPCDEDERCWRNKRIPRNTKAKLTQRSDAVNEAYDRQASLGIDYQRVIMIHIDSRSQDQRADMFFYYYPGQNKGMRLARTLRTTIESKYAKFQSNRGYTGTISGRDLHMLRETKPVGVYIELGNIANKLDQNRFKLESNRQAVADWLKDGLIRDYTNNHLKR